MYPCCGGRIHDPEPAPEPAPRTDDDDAPARSDGGRAVDARALPPSLARPRTDAGLATGEADKPSRRRGGGAVPHALQLAVCSTSIAVCVRLLGILPETGFRTLVVVLLALPAWDLARRARPVEGQPERRAKAATSGQAVDALVEHFERRAAWEPHARMDRATCRRFLVARKGDYQAALSMLERYATWRAEARPDMITAADVRREFASRKCYAHGVDRENRGIAWVFVERHDKNKRDLEEMVRFIPFCMERAIALSEKVGTEKICIVFDLAGFGLKSMDYELVKKLINILASFYPERLGKVVMWNGPSLFNLFWRVVKPWIDPNTVKKISFVSDNELADYVDPSHFPKEVVDRIGAAARR